MWYLYAMEFYSATKKNEMDGTEEHHLKKGSRAQKAKNHMFSLICGLQTQDKCSNIIGHGSHTKGRTCTGEIG
jgi:hypothetical protein